MLDLWVYGFTRKGMYEGQGCWTEMQNAKLKSKRMVGSR